MTAETQTLSEAVAAERAEARLEFIGAIHGGAGLSELAALRFAQRDAEAADLLYRRVRVVVERCAALPDVGALRKKHERTQAKFDTVRAEADAEVEKIEARADEAAAKADAARQEFFAAQQEAVDLAGLLGREPEIFPDPLPPSLAGVKVRLDLEAAVEDARREVGAAKERVRQAAGALRQMQHCAEYGSRETGGMDSESAKENVPLLEKKLARAKRDVKVAQKALAKAERAQASGVPPKGGAKEAGA